MTSTTSSLLNFHLGIYYIYLDFWVTSKIHALQNDSSHKHTTFHNTIFKWYFLDIPPHCWSSCLHSCQTPGHNQVD